jgi:hypothetical protein
MPRNNRVASVCALPTSLRLTPYELEWVKDRAKRSGLGVTRVVRMCIRKEMARESEWK